MKRAYQALGVILLSLAGLMLANGCGPRQPTLRLKVLVDGVDVVKISGNKLWFEHKTFQLPGRPIYVNGKAWNLQFHEQISEPYVHVNPVFQPGNPDRIRISKKAGRGAVSVVEMPSSENNETLAIKIDDDAFGGADWYDILISW